MFDIQKLWCLILLLIGLIGTINGFFLPRPKIKPLVPFKPKKNTPMEIKYPDSKRFECSSNRDRIGSNSGVPDEKYRWRKGFFVQPDPSFTKAEYDIINAAMYDLKQILCIPVLMWPSSANATGDYAFIKRGLEGGCSAHVGRIGGRQLINLQYNGCMSKGTVLHESIHALGFNHEQNRPDRDDYVTILWENIEPGTESNFRQEMDSLTFNVSYDQVSIMHYGAQFFSKNGKDTIVAKDNKPVGTTGSLTSKDIQKIKNMYNCK